MQRDRAGRAGRRVAPFAAAALVVAAVTVAAAAASTGVVEAAPCDQPIVNPVACENTKPGSPESEWGISGAGDSSIQGFATDISVDQGGTIGFKVDTTASSFRLDIYRMGYYGGLGARFVTTVQPTSVRKQPNCLTDSTTGLVDCGNWTQSASWTVPADAVSGIYFAKLVRTDGTSGASHVYFVVRDDDGRSAMLFQTSDTTWQAYNRYGGNSLYSGSPAGRAYKVSYNRPFTTRDYSSEDMVFNAEYPMVRFLESNGYDVSYSTGVDTDRRGAELLEHKVFLSVGHDEYWSGQQRANVEAARAAGVHLAFFSGNEMFWKTRWEPSIDGSGTAYRTLVTYKETLANQVIDPAAPTWTGTWRDPRFSPPGDGGRPENAVTGQIFMVNCCAVDMVVNAADGRMRFWRNTRVAALTGSQTTTIGSSVIGYEWDQDLDNGFRPPGAFRLSETAATGDILQDYGSTYASGSATHSMTMYRASSGALVFGAGTVQWSWALDGNHDRGSAPPDSAAQQATVNLFADMGVQPATLQPGLTATTASADTTAPTSTITSPTAGSNVGVGASVTVTGTAVDAGGGRVGGVEVSVDGGTTWHPATGRESWSYTFQASVAGSVTIRSRATDDSGRTEAPAAGVTITVGGTVACPCTIWPATTTPAATDADTSAVELGVKFRSSQAGYVTAIRFHKSTANTGTHVGTLWTGTGTKLASVTFTNETASGWQQATLATPVAIQANTTYVASYFAPNGRYSVNSAYFASSPAGTAPLTALQSGTDGGNGVYRYGSTAGTFPTSTYNAENYWVDVVFTTSTGPDTTAPTVTSQSPTPGAAGVAVGAPVSATFSEPVQAGSVTVSVTPPGGAAVAGATTLDGTGQTATFTPSSPLAASTQYTVTVSGARDAAGNTMQPVSWTFTTAAAAPPPGACPCSIWSPATVPAGTDPDSTAVEVGVKFRSTQAGYVTGVRFYKAAANTGTHVGSLWSRGGTRLANVTFTNETASGWQQATFSTPVAVQANTTYVVSYFAPVGRYSVNSAYFASTGVTNGPLTALRSGVDGGNAVYRYTTRAGAFPNKTYNAENYWVDVVFVTSLTADTTAPTVTSRTPAAGATGVDVGTTVSAVFSEPVQSGSAQVTLTPQGGAAVSGATAMDGLSQTVTFTPSAPLAASTQYTATVSGARDAAGNTMQPVSWTFTTAAPVSYGCPCTIFSTSTVPPTQSANDTSAVEVGVKFRTAASGYVKAIRFYKGAGNTGTHVGNLWTASGTLLASVTFTGETSSGWQEAILATPVAVQANTTYVASYHAPAGRYALAGNGFASAVTNGPLTALASGTDGGNGVYAYGGGGFPTSTFDASNYFVDVVFDTTAADTTPPSITTRTPASGETAASVSAPVLAGFNEPIVASSAVISLTGPGSTAVNGAQAYDAGTRTLSFTPSADLDYSTTYTVAVRGIRDTAGNAMADTSWSFTTAGPPPPLPTDGPGGPIGVVTSGADPFTGYLAEILRGEGLNEFATFDVSQISATTLAAYRTVVVGHVRLSDAQVSTLSTWVAGGGNLIASRPDARLASLLGLTPASGTLADAYLRVDTSTEPGAGIVADTVQFHGPADRYTLNGARAVATLYSDASTATTAPAVTVRDVGTSGGSAAAFTYDLARSVVLTRQGNVAWAGQERDGDSNNVIRSDDLYYGGGVPDYVDLTKVAIPQADEQQRLLANLIQYVNRDAMPLPRFWYFPGQHRAVVVATGDDHATGGTSGRFNTYLANSPAGCSTLDWQCLRFTSYVYPSTPLTDSAAASYDAQGFEIGVHPNNGCTNFTPDDLRTTYASSLSAWRQAFPSLPSPVTNRFHCMVWSDWSTQADVEHENGMRLDVNYYYWPGSWVNDRPGFMTGSGMPQRFARADGTLVDVYQAATLMTDESGQTYPFTPDTLLDRAQGTQGFYGYFVANMHTDQPTTQQDDALVSSARSRGVPVVSARDVLRFIDGRNRSSFQQLAWSGSTLTFGIGVDPAARNLTAMVPTAGPGGLVLDSIVRGTTPVAFTRVTIKGLEYAMFAAATGTYSATYAAPAAPLQLTALSSTATTTSSTTGGTATVAWSTDAPASSQVVYGTSATSLDRTVTEGGAAGTHDVQLTGLSAGTTYYYRVISQTPDGERSTWPPANRPPARVRVPAADRKAPQISELSAFALADGTLHVAWRTDEPADAAVLFTDASGAFETVGVGSAGRTEHRVIVTGLTAGATYSVRVASSDAAGNRALSGGRAESVVVPAAGVADYTSASRHVGTTSGGAVLAEADDATAAVTLAPGATVGAFESRVLDARQQVHWAAADWQATVPAGSAVEISVRGGDSEQPGPGWTDWQPLAGPGAALELSSRFVQYRVVLRAAGTAVPSLAAVSITHTAPAPTTIVEADHDG